uniref:Uncharacterized protein n=1 Tax=Acrobeloides nanus TaxID=290746 RepID=A0A914D0H3_9BILA
MKLAEMRITQLSELAQRRILKILDDSLYEEENGNSNYYIGGVLCVGQISTSLPTAGSSTSIIGLRESHDLYQTANNDLASTSAANFISSSNERIRFTNMSIPFFESR